MAIPTTDTEIQSRETTRTYSDIARDIGRAAAQGVTMGFSDELYGMAQSFFYGRPYEEARDEIRAGIEKFRETDPTLAYGFEILGGMTTGVAGGVKAAGTAVGKQILSNVGKKAFGTGVAAVEGGIYGAGAAEEMETVPYGVGTGMATGLVGGAVGEALTPVATKAASEMLKRGYPLTVGQRFGGTLKSLEEKMSLPFLRETIQEAQQRPVRQFRRETVENALEGLNVKLPKDLRGEDLVEYAEDAVSDAYSKIVPKLAINTAPVEAAAATIAGRLKMSGAFSDADIVDFNKLIAGTFKRNITDGSLSKQMLKDTESEISAEIRSLMTKGGMNDRRIGKALREFQEVFRSEIAKQNPNVPDLQAVNRAFAKLRPISKAKERATGRGGEFTPVQLLAAQRQAGVPRTAPEVTMARQARDVLGVTSPTSGTAERYFASRPTSSVIGLLGAGVAEPMYSGAGQKLVSGLLRGIPQGMKYASPAVSQTGLLEDYMTVAP